MFSLCGPQKLPALTEPVTVFVVRSMWTVASVLPDSELDVRSRMLAGWSAGNVNWPAPVRGVVVTATVAPLSRPTR